MRSLRLIDMSSDYEELFNMFDDIDDIVPETNDDGEPVDNDGNVIDDIDEWKESIKEQWMSELIEKEDEFENKAENVGQYIKNLKIESDALNDEIKKLQARKKAADNKVERMKTYLMSCMNQTGINKIETARCKLTIRNNAESVIIDDEKSFINNYAESHKELFNFKPEISKTKIKKAIQSGEKINGAIIGRTQSIIVK